MDRSRTALLFLLSAGLVSCLGCEEGNQAGDDDTISAPEPSPCDTGYRQDPELPAEFIGDFPDGCVPQECGIGRWGGAEVDGETIYVDAHAADGGDGAEEAPFTSIQEGIDAAGEAGGGRVAVAAGNYVENLLLTKDHDGVGLVGRCRELAVVDASEGDEGVSGIRAGGGWSVGGSWSVTGLSVTGAPDSGLWLEAGQMRVEDSLFVGNRRYGVYALDAQSKLDLVNVDILDTLTLDDGSRGRGLAIQAGATVRAENCRVEGNVDVGIMIAEEGTTVDLWNVVVRDTQPDPEGSGGRGLEIQMGASLTAEDCLFEHNSEIGINIGNDGTSALLTNVT